MAQSRTNAAGASAVSVRAGATRLRGVRVEQRAPAAPALFLQVFNTNSPTVGTTAPVLVVPVPAGSGQLSTPTLRAIFKGTQGALFLSTGLAYAVTTTPTGSTGPTGGQEPTVIVDYEPLG